MVYIDIYVVNMMCVCVCVYIYIYIYTKIVYIYSVVSDLQVLSGTCPKITSVQFLLLLNKLCIRSVSFKT